MRDRSVTNLSQKLEAQGQCIPPPRHVLPSYWYHDISPAIWRIGSRSPPKFNHLSTGPLPKFPEKIHANPFRYFCAMLLPDKQTDINDEKITSLAEVTKTLYCISITGLDYTKVIWIIQKTTLWCALKINLLFWVFPKWTRWVENVNVLWTNDTSINIILSITN